ncbi:sensor histidine kinase [Nocardiopsis sp. MG754419]|uniref:sensor histidine kinase n=1 Tax=Nocardiopsis sp. MG754419 TaxID=2259865 RepID=UPI001BAE2EAA|nr:histidine kinase [Nocardiopsis sp. MG754419]MBR8742618.1 sensor histidine kinase [Nocardiopsis sp. MG754419]
MFGRVRRWFRQHTLLVDTISVAPFLLLTLGTLLGRIEDGQSGPSFLALVITCALLLPMTLRRTFPMAAFVAVAAVGAVQLGLDVGLIAADFALVVALYTVASLCRPTRAIVALVVVEAGLVLAIVQDPYSGWDDWDAFAAYTFFILLCWVTGLYVKVRRRYFVGLEERAQWLEWERDARAQAAAAEERERIAREMHDVVAHNLSVMVVQAEGATYALDHDPPRAKEALRTVSATGRAALAEVRGILGVLREGGDEEEYEPRPGIEQLDRVADRVRGAGLPVDLVIEGDRRRLATGVELAAHRVVQEALTNTLKHAGPGVSRVRVRVRYGEDSLELRILDDGWGAPAPGEGAQGRGHGLIGMRERVSVYGGSVHAGSRVGGGYEVVASLPLRPVDG